MKIAFFSTQPYDRHYFEACPTQHELIFFEAMLQEQTVNLAKGCSAVCVFVNDRLNATVIQALAALGVKLVALRCAGYNNVDVTAATKHGIRVVRVPAYSPHAVAEHALALIMTLNRKTHKAYNRVRDGNFSLHRLTGFDLYKKTVGVIGTGQIGACFANIMLGLGCKVLAYDVKTDASLERAGVQYVTMNALLSQSDIVSLHCPLVKETTHLINDQSLRQMKRGAMLINTSRGGLVNTHNVIQALKTGQLGYVGIDVYEQEAKLFFHDLSENIIDDEIILRLMSFPNVLITSHQGFLTDEALTQIAAVTLKNIDDFENGLPLHNGV
ncbi:MAG: 2-hydroxyacid dehydrogenase [Chitinophagaceae bacterium]|nr:MAG: 2-hydroxyacid dehydrogenase [Chitinophagaceae bacterium]